MGIREDLWRKRLFFDGGMGTLLQAQGLGAGEKPEPWNLTRPKVVSQIHSMYLASGADVLTANTFGANRYKMEGAPYTVQQVVEAGVRLAKQAIETSGKEAYAAVDIGPTGQLFAPYGTLEFEDAVEVFGEMVQAGVAAGADLVLIETMSDMMEVKAAILAAKEYSSLPVVVTMTFDEKGKLLMGSDIVTAVTIAEALGVDAVGMNCGLGPYQLVKLLPEFLGAACVPVVLNPNAGLPVTVDGKTSYSVGPEEFAGVMKDLVAQGVQAAGGCCGTTPEHIAALVAACRDIPSLPAAPKKGTRISSGRVTVQLDRFSAAAIGGRLNAAENEKLRAALMDEDMDTVMDEAFSDEEDGARILLVNGAVPGLDEGEILDRIVRELQASVTLPLVLDAADPGALESALRHYNGRPLVSSSCGEKEFARQLLPLAKKYGAVVALQPLTGSGISAGEVQARLEAAKAFGMGENDLFQSL